MLIQTRPVVFLVCLIGWSAVYAQKAAAPDLVAQGEALQDGFIDEHVADTSGSAVGITYDPNGRLYIWERTGAVYMVEDGVLLPNPLIDLSDEVGRWRDHGLLGFALDPGFLQNGEFYLFYVVDRHHLLNAGTANYDPNADEYFDATIGRITRYAADPATGFTTTLPSSRLVLLGETPSTGVPIVHDSHGLGSLFFGEDGTLLATAGDGASFAGVDAGSASGTYWAQALADGIIRAEENVGAFRAQLIDSHNGKVLRLDPATGDGLPSNPFFDAANPRSARSRTWALGLRNPFRSSVRPGTGQSDPSLGDPGTLYVGDVGWATWEELHVIDESGMNLGWPLFEGLTEQPSYMAAITDNMDAPNPLSCAAFFTFQDLLEQEQLDGNPDFPNPCDSSVTIPPGTPTFMHRRAVIEWRHSTVTPSTRTPIFIGNDAAESIVGDPGSEVEGDPFNGNCSIGGFWHSGQTIPGPFAGSYFVADFTAGWIRCFAFHDDDDDLEALYEFACVNGVVDLVEDPTDGSLVYVTIATGEVRRIRYDDSLDAPPVAAVESDLEFGPTPLTVHFDGTPSFDPDGGLLSFSWDFGDGASSALPSPTHTFALGDGLPNSSVVTLSITDAGNFTTTTSMTIGLDNTPPAVEITSPIDGVSYSTSSTTTVALTADVSDAEDALANLAYSWEVFLHHDTHNHPEPPDTNPSTTALISPTPCDGEFYAFRIKLTVSDPLGLEGTDDVWLFPDCSPASTASVSLAADPPGPVFPGELVTLTASPSGAFDTVAFYADSIKLGEISQAPYDLTWIPTTPGSVRLTAFVTGTDGTSASSPGLPIEVLEPLLYRHRLTQSEEDAEEWMSTGFVSVSNPDLDMTFDRGFEQTVGLLFPVDVPPGSFISNAFVQFHTNDTDPGQADLIISAEAIGVPAPITMQNFDLSSRPTTNASVSWSPAAWDYVQASGARQRTPNLAPILQELVDRADWSNPGSVLLLITGSGQRAAESADGDLALAPELFIEFAGGGNTAPIVAAGPDLALTSLRPASLSGTVSDDGYPNGQLSSLWSLVAGPGSVTFADASAPQTTARFSAEGNYILRLTADDGFLQTVDDVVVDVSAGRRGTLEVQVSSGTEDAEERTDTGEVRVSNVDLELGQDGDRPHQVGLRFKLDVPAGATITNAYVQFVADEVWSVPTDLAIFAEAADDAAPMSSARFDLSSRPPTEALVTWSPADWVAVGDAGTEQRAPDIQAVLQEIVSRPGWQSGNHVLLFVTGTGTRTSESYEGSPLAAPLLHVEY